MNELLEASICLDDVPEQAIRKSKNGKRYLNYYISKRMNVGNYGETHAAYVIQTSGGGQIDKKYIGSAKPFEKR